MEICACRKVDYTPVLNEDGSYTEQWMCLDCKSIFVRKKSSMCDVEIKDDRALLEEAVKLLSDIEITIVDTEASEIINDFLKRAKERGKSKCMLKY